MIRFVNLSRQYESIREEILQVTDEVMSTGNYFDGPMIENLEDGLEKLCNYPYVVCVGTGTDALRFMARYYMEQLRSAYDMKVQGKKPTVVVPALTYPATINAWILEGFNVIIGDTDRYGCLDWNKLDALEDRYDVICYVGLYGRPMLEDLHLRHVQRRGKIICEDGAQHWTTKEYTHHTVMRSISFDPMKNLPNYGGGGAIDTWDSKSHDWFRRFRNGGKPDMEMIGTNSKMSEIDAAQMLVKLKKFHEWQDRRLEIANYWLDRFKEAEIQCLIGNRIDLYDHGLQKFVIQIEKRNSILQDLREKGIECKIHYRQPLHEMDLYRSYAGPGMLSTSSALARRVLSLPFYPELSDSEVEIIADEVIHHVEKYNIGPTTPNHS
jgi:dTDP-4-amino-4,6-dideoxygalactose transaminase